MALMSPATTEADVDRHTDVFAEATAADHRARVTGREVPYQGLAPVSERRPLSWRRLRAERVRIV